MSSRTLMTSLRYLPNNVVFADERKVDKPATTLTTLKILFVSHLPESVVSASK